jgi:hypothetical protein
LLEIIRQKSRIDDFGQVDVPGQRTHALLDFDDAFHSIKMDVAVAPIRNALSGAADQVLDGACRYFRGDVEGFAISPASSG